MTPYTLARDAERDLEQVWDYIAEDNAQSADRVISLLFEAFEAISNNPGIGHAREDLTSAKVLFWPVGNYLVIYRVVGGLVEIVAVVHGKRDIPKFLLPRSLNKIG